MNRDTLYSAAVFDLDAGPVTITLPDPGKRFLSMQMIDEDEYTPEVLYGAPSARSPRTRSARATPLSPCASWSIRTIPRTSRRSTRCRTPSRSASPADREPSRRPTGTHQPGQGAGRSAELGSTVPDTKGMFGPKGEVDPVRHLIGSAIAWGGNPEKDALYLNVTPAHNDGKTVYRLTVKDVPVDGFWSISVYNDEGHFAPIPTTPIRLTTSLRSRPPTARSRSNSVAATASRQLSARPAGLELSRAPLSSEPES